LKKKFRESRVSTSGIIEEKRSSAKKKKGGVFPTSPLGEEQRLFCLFQKGPSRKTLGKKRKKWTGLIN